jgi:peptide/nickel transport system substrate-binding protein
MSIKKWSTVLGVIVILSMLLSACATPTPQVIEKIVEKPVEKIVEKVVEKPVEKVVEKEKQVVVTATPVPPTPVPPKPAEKPADTAVLALQQEPDTLHPLIGSMMARTIVMGAVIIGCIGQNDKADWVHFGCDGPVPTIDNGGAKWVGEGADKHLEVTHKIKAGWRWTDGTPVTTKDVIYNWKLVMDPEMQVAARDTAQKIYDLKAVDANTWVTIFMSEKQAKEAAAGTLKGNVPFDKFKADYVESGFADQKGPVVDSVYWTVGTGWLPEHVLGKVAGKDQPKAEFSRKPLGDGPYVVKEWKQGQEIVLEKSDKPFPLGDAKIKTIIFRFFAETPAVIAALQKGEIDAVTGTGGLTVANSPDLDKIAAAGVYKMMYEPGYQWEHIDLNTTKFPLNDIKVRQALYHATDKKTLVDRLYFGKQATTDLPIPKGISWGWSDNYNKYPFDKAKAAALLKDAGWDCKALPCTKEVDEGGKKVKKNLEITLMTTDRADRQALAQVIQAQWKAVNVGVNIQFLYGRGLFATAEAGGPLSSRSFDAAIYTWITGDDPQFKGLYNCASIPSKDNNFSGQNYPGWCNKTADTLAIQNEDDPDISLSRDKRKPVLEKWFQEWTKDVPVIPLFANTRVYAARTGFKNWMPGPTSASPDTWNVWQWELSK